MYVQEDQVLSAKATFCMTTLQLSLLPVAWDQRYEMAKGKCLLFHVWDFLRFRTGEEIADLALGAWKIKCQRGIWC